MEELKIPQAPDFLFKKTEEIVPLNENQPIYLIEKMEAVENYGICIYYKNVPYPKKGFPTPEAITAINTVKKDLLIVSKLLKNPFFILGVITTPKTKLLIYFNESFDKKFKDFKVKDEFMCPASRYFSNFVSGVLQNLKIDESTAKEFSFNIAQILEYDDAYRYRFQDIMSELNINLFNKNPRKELKRLFKILQERTTDGVANDKVRYLFEFILIFTPFIKKPLINNIEYLKKCERDISDWYWSCLRADHYMYKGMSIEDRHQQFTERPIAYKINSI